MSDTPISDTPMGPSSGSVVKRAGGFVQPPGKVVFLEIKEASVPPNDEPRWSWWATVDRHPYSDKVGYTDPDLALQAAGAWVAQNYPQRSISLKE